MKYLLAFVICSTVSKDCTPPIEAGFYDDYKKCALKGYQGSINMINTIDEKIFKDKKYIIKFNCMELKDNI